MGRRPRQTSGVHVVTNRRQGRRREYVTHLLRRSYREGGRVRNETVGNISHLPEEVVELVRRALRGERFVPAGEEFEIECSLPQGHVEAALRMARKLELERLLDRSPSRERRLCLAMLIQRLLEPGSKLQTARSLGRSTLGEELGVEGADEDDLYAALDWLLERQQRIERALAGRHLRDGTLVLYDVSSSYFEGESCPLAARGYSRDERRSALQIVWGLLCDPAGRPLAVEVFEGSLHDDATLPAQLEKLRERFALREVVVVSDRGMVTKANLEALGAAGYGWITALRAPQLKRLARQGELQLSLFDEHNLAEIESEDFPGERLVCCRNPLVAAERDRKREDLLLATERALAEVARRVERGTLSGRDRIGLAAGAVWNRFKMRKHFELEIADDRFAFHRNQDRIEAEAALDGIYVLRTTVPEQTLAAPEVVRSYKQLKEVERAFRTLKGVDLLIRPIHHRLEQRVRAHVLLCMLAYYLEWHLRQAWAELLFDDEQPAPQPDPVAKATRSPQAERKAQTKHNRDGLACQSFRDLLSALALRTRNTIRLVGTKATFDKLAEPTAVQRRALELLERA